MFYNLGTNQPELVETLSERESELISGGAGAGLVTALKNDAQGIPVALANGACNTPSQCGQNNPILGSNIGGGSLITAPAATAINS